MSETGGQDLERFQDSADPDGLLRHVRRAGKDPQKYQEAVNALAPVFDALAAGKKPSYEGLGRGRLRARPDEVGDILRWMAESRRAEMRISALELMGVVADESFVADLARHISAEGKTERLAAIASLGETGSERAVEALKAVMRDPDPEIRAATGAAFFNLSSKL